MAEREEIFSSKIKYNGLFPFADFYKFCYVWLDEEENFNLSEDKYSEKLIGEAKDLEIEWKGTKKVTDYFKFEVKAVFKIVGMSQVEINKGGLKLKTNKGGIELSMKGTLIRDYDGKFEKTAFQKFLRSIYEKWVIKARIDQHEEKLIKVCDGFLTQAKAYLDLEGRK